MKKLKFNVVPSENIETTVQYKDQKYNVFLKKGIVWYSPEGEKVLRSQGQSDDYKVWSKEGAEKMALDMIKLDEKNGNLNLNDW